MSAYNDIQSASSSPLDSVWILEVLGSVTSAASVCDTQFIIVRNMSTLWFASDQAFLWKQWRLQERDKIC